MGAILSFHGFLMLDAFHSNAPAPAQRSEELHNAKLPPRFALGKVLGTPGVLHKMLESGTDAFGFLERHGRGDWGDMTQEDRNANDTALVEGGRLFSAYELPDGGKVWVITEADRSSTTLLLPEEY